MHWVSFGGPLSVPVPATGGAQLDELGLGGFGLGVGVMVVVHEYVLGDDYPLLAYGDHSIVGPPLGNDASGKCGEGPRVFVQVMGVGAPSHQSRV